LYVTVEPGAELPPDFAPRAFAQLASGGRMEVNLQPALEGAIPLPQEAVLELHWRGAYGSASAHVPVRLPVASARETLTPGAGGPARGTQKPSPVAVGRDDSVLPGYLLWIAVGVAVLLTVASLLAWYVRRRPREPRREPGWAETLELNARSFAYLEIQDEMHTRHPVSGESFRIGRHSDNQLMLPDASISRHHAEIRHELNSRYVIRDLDSLNGVYVNGRKARTAILSNGDIIELGDVTLKFTVFAAHESPELESTRDSTVTPFRPTDKKKGLRPQ
ncbi:MAG: FHA domain-containing protein, partial [Gammaproteobacteria bacterium]|nr:FHA domain-containing protein [Gammaproteobacteria bacterium]